MQALGCDFLKVNGVNNIFLTKWDLFLNCYTLADIGGIIILSELELNRNIFYKI